MRRFSTHSPTQSFTLMMIATFISVGGTFLMSIGMGAGIRMNAERTLHPYRYFTAWRYGLASAMPVFAMGLTWIYKWNNKMTLMDTLHKVITFSNLCWLGFVLAYEGILVLPQCDNPSSTFVYDHPQCINRNTPSDSAPDVSWQLMFVGIIVQTACSIWWVICSFTIPYSTAAVPYQEAAYEVLQGDVRDREALRGGRNDDVPDFEGSKIKTSGTGRRHMNFHTNNAKGGGGLSDYL